VTGESVPISGWVRCDLHDEALLRVRAHSRGALCESHDVQSLFLSVVSEDTSAMRTVNQRPWSEKNSPGAFSRVRRAAILGFIRRWILEGVPASLYEGRLLRWWYFLPPPERHPCEIWPGCKNAWPDRPCCEERLTDGTQS
jgi:hypothetical protein